MGDFESILASLQNLSTDPEGAARLVSKWRAACAAWPTITLAPERFLQLWDQTFAHRTRLADVLETVHFDDLYLAIACGDGSPAALALFDERLLAPIPGYLGRVGVTPGFADEVRQAVRMRLFVGDKPKIASYAGTGPLGAWVRVVTIRCARDLQRTAHPEASFDEGNAVASPRPDPELDYLKVRYGEEFRAAFAEVLAGLEARERNLLRLHFLDGLTVEAIGGLFGVNKSTVSRRLAQSRERILIETRRILEERLGVGASELSSLFRLVESRVEVSLRSLLATRR
jgi:RNA polymerase sigma-70 factor (ECF subfamily)